MFWLKCLIVEEAGQDLIEYALLAAFISLAVVASIDIIGKSLNSTYDGFSKQIDGFSAS
jgi:Flp pilus assembly pilin Flp